MVRYRRNFVAGGTYFFTVTLADRTSSALIHHVSALRNAFRIARQERPFKIEAKGLILVARMERSGMRDFRGEADPGYASLIRATSYLLVRAGGVCGLGLHKKH